MNFRVLTSLIWMRTAYYRNETLRILERINEFPLYELHIIRPICIVFLILEHLPMDSDKYIRCYTFTTILTFTAIHLLPIVCMANERLCYISCITFANFHILITFCVLSFLSDKAFFMALHRPRSLTVCYKRKRITYVLNIYTRTYVCTWNSQMDIM